MKLSLLRVAARRGLGGFICPAISDQRQHIPFLSRQKQPLWSYQKSQSSRRTLSNAATSHKQDAHNAPTNNTNQASKPPQTTTEPSNPSISEHVRLLMRRVPYPVAIITSSEPPGPADTTSFRGMTVSSFNTVTLTPNPVISFNVRRPSETLNALLASGRFLVHLLSPGPATATLARDFSKGNTSLATMLSGDGQFEFVSLNPSCQYSDSHTDMPGPLPLLRRKADGASDIDFPFIFECTLHPQKIDVHDHTIVLGTIVRVLEGQEVSSQPHLSGDDVPDEHSPQRLCLTYANTKFWKMGNEL